MRLDLPPFRPLDHTVSYLCALDRRRNGSLNFIQRGLARKVLFQDGPIDQLVFDQAQFSPAHDEQLGEIQRQSWLSILEIIFQFEPGVGGKFCRIPIDSGQKHLPLRTKIP